MCPETHEIIARRSAIISKLKHIIISSLNLELEPDELAEDSQLFGFGLGLDSIDALTLVVGVEDGFNLHVPEDQPYILRSLNTIADFLIDHGGQHAY